MDGTQLRHFIELVMLTVEPPVTMAFSSCTKLMRKSVPVKDINLISVRFVPGADIADIMMY
ncbi:hypothetical protein BBB56_21430 [Candidatus Pantoea deserta]|uniref:Uncharacterized protein n=1 Tax=Candidatus Pantoea deserta TaxID=1869313 RepID=A0A3N4NM30_9GAMM|nr:hypothetical protein BBB56_21430 [Pantoea deserta]